MNRSSPLPWLLALAMALAALLPALPAQAADYLQLANAWAGDETATAPIQDGTTIDRFYTQFQLAFSDQLDPASVTANLSVTDGTGTAVTWRTEVAQRAINLFPPAPLDAPSTYTLQVRGGPNGVKTTGGLALQSDIVLHINTMEVPFRLVQVSNGTDPLSDWGVLPRNATAVRILFSHPVQADSAAAAIHVTRSDGSDAHWTVSEVRGHQVTLAIPGRLPMANDTYAITSAADPHGLTDTLGEPLADAVHFTLQTLNRPYPFSVRFPTNYHRFDVVQADHFRFQASAGDIRFELEGGDTPVVAHIVLVDEQANQRIYGQDLRVGPRTTFSTSLPRDGRYSLFLFDNRLEFVSITANELEFSGVTPAIALPAIADFATENSPFSFAPQLFNPGETERVAIWRDGTLLTQNALGPGGQIQPTTVDTTGLQDGIYNIYAIGKAVGSENTGYNWLPILVDRVDTFADVPKSHWAHTYIEVMFHLGIVNGVDSTTYAPGRAVTRAEFAKLLTLTLGLPPAAPSAPNPFVDIDGHWAAPYILALYQAGLVTGDVRDGKRYFDPKSTVDRAQAATMLGRALGVSNQPVNGRPFADWDQVPDWAKPYVAALAESGWINGFPDGSFHPADPLNRDQAAKLLAKFIGM